MFGVDCCLLVNAGLSKLRELQAFICMKLQIPSAVGKNDSTLQHA